MSKKLFKIRIDFDLLVDELDGKPTDDYPAPDKGGHSLEWYERQHRLQSALIADPAMLRKYVEIRLTDFLRHDAFDDINKMLGVKERKDEDVLHERLLKKVDPETELWFRSAQENGVLAEALELVTLSFELITVSVDISDQ